MESDNCSEAIQLQERESCVLACEEWLPQQGVASKLRCAITNLAYNLKTNWLVSLPFNSRKLIQLTGQYDRASLLGHFYSFHQREQFLRAFKSTIWFSYRAEAGGDVGWGCMIRVVQMLMAEVFTRNRPDMQIQQLLDLFRDSKQGKLGLKSICRTGGIAQRWTSCPEILSIVNSICATLQHQQGISFQFDIFSDALVLEPVQNYQSTKFPKLITIHVPPRNHPEHQGHLLELMHLPQFAGMVVGKDSEALFVVGEYKETAIILDPHYTQGVEDAETFFQKVPVGIDLEDLHSSMTLNFYVASIEEFEEWAADLVHLDRLYAPQTVFGLLSQDPHWTDSRRKISDDFQTI